MRKLQHTVSRTRTDTHGHTDARLRRALETLDISHEVDCGDDSMINEIRYEIDIRRRQEASAIVVSTAIRQYESKKS